MISLFDSIYPDKRLASSNQLQIMLKLFQQDLMNGLVEISYSPEDKILLLLNGGKITCAYHCEGDLITRCPLSNLPVLLNGRSEGEIRACELAPSFLRAVKTIVEQPHSSNSLLSITTGLPSVIQQYQATSEPSLLHIRWPRAEGFVFLPGNNFSPRQYSFLSEGQSSDSAGAVSMFSRWSEAECTISQYAGDPEREIWKENNLQLGFALLIEQIMRRHEELVGHLLSRKLEDNLNRLTQTQSWNITIAATTVNDVQIFDSLLDAAAAYRSILDLASRQINVVIGTRLFNEALETSLDSLSQQLRQAVEHNELVPAASAAH
jgi:hypothetical protein